MQLVLVLGYCYPIDRESKASEKNVSRYCMLTENISLNRETDVHQAELSKVLVVEDEPIFQKHSLKVLEYFDVCVDLAKYGKEALRCCERTTYDLILMDYELPDTKGVQVAKKILELPSYQTRPSCIVGLTSHLPSEVKMQCMEAGMVDVISKPIDRHLLKCVAEHIGLYLPSR